MSKPEQALHLLLIEEQLEQAEFLISHIRNGGIAVRPERVDDSDQFEQLLDTSRIDLVLADAASDVLPMSSVTDTIQRRGKDIPVIAILEHMDDAVVLKALSDGAADTVIRGEPKQIQHVIRQQFHALLNRRQIRHFEADLRECLMLQLRAAGQRDSTAYQLVEESFEELIAHRWSELSKRFGISAQDVQRAADEIAKLDPKPGLRYSAGGDNYIIPDLVVDKIGQAYHIFLNDGNLPRLKLSRAYQEIARDKKKFDTESKDFIASKLNAAHWMIQAIEQRRQTMLKVMHFIVDRQSDFFERGVQALRPLTLREVAEAVGMHESTVSRVTNEKFVQTPRGVLPLKFFFSSGLATSDGDDVSARGIKDQLQKLVSGEDTKNPLTDQAIVEILQQTGVQIARRTVAKYRDQLGVLPARMRKRV